MKLFLVSVIVSVAFARYDMSHITDEMKSFINTTKELKGLVELAEKASILRL